MLTRPEYKYLNTSQKLMIKQDLDRDLYRDVDKIKYEDKYLSTLSIRKLEKDITRRVNEKHDAELKARGINHI